MLYGVFGFNIKNKRWKRKDGKEKSMGDLELLVGAICSAGIMHYKINLNNYSYDHDNNHT
jgi:hypothetical protein